MSPYMISGEHCCRISAIMAVYNPDPSFFSKAVDSILCQSHPVFELLLVNDGGSESFRELLPDDPRIRVISKKNEGVAATRNVAITHARGDYIALLDQDDYWYPDKLQEQIAMIPEPGTICMVISPVDIVDENGNMTTSKKTLKIATAYNNKTRNDDFLLNLAEGNYIFSSTPLIHRRIFDCVGLFDPYTQPHDDWDMYLRVAFAGIPVYCYQGRSLSVWRIHDFNESHKVQAMLRSKCRVEKKLLLHVHDRDLKQVLYLNLLIDAIGRDSLLYKKGRYRFYRMLIRQHLPKLVQAKIQSSKKVSSLMRQTHRIRKTVVKASRRYVVSFFYWLK